jgi:hypothetical protein
MKTPLDMSDYCILRNAVFSPDLMLSSPPLAPPHSNTAAAERVRLVEARDAATPETLYQLYISCQYKGERQGIPHRLRTYVSNELANHDALSWIVEQHKIEDAEVRNKEGTATVCHVFDAEFHAHSRERCIRYTTTWEQSLKWGKRYSVWTVEEILY